MGLTHTEEPIYRGIDVGYGKLAAQVFADVALCAIGQPIRWTFCDGATKVVFPMCLRGLWTGRLLPIINL